MQNLGSIFDIAESLPIHGKYKYIQSLNEFGSDQLLLNVELMDLKLELLHLVGTLVV